MVGQSPVRVSDIGEAKDAQQIQYNVVRVDGQRSVYLPVLKQGGDTNTIAVVDGIRDKARASWSTFRTHCVTRGGLRSVASS